MNERKRIFVLISILVVSSLLVTGITIGILYRVAMNQQLARLMETAQSQARLIEAVARFDKLYSKDFPASSEEATLSQIIDAYNRYKGFGKTGEFTLAKRQGDDILFLLSLRHNDLQSPERIPYHSHLAEPMRLALAGQSGGVVGLDYRGERVLAAHEPIQELNCGIVAKIDLKEIRAPFLTAGVIALCFTAFVILGGSALFLRISNPIVWDLQERSLRLTIANEKMKQEAEERNKAENSLKWELAVNSTLSQLYKPLISLTTSIENIANAILKEAMDLTGSMHGYVSSINPETGVNIGHTLTDMLKGHCQVSGEDMKITFPAAENGLYHGLWGHSLNTLEPFFTNAPKMHKASTGLPKGHIPIQRLLSVPVTLGKELVGQIALANKNEDYLDQDLEAVSRIAEFYALAIQLRRTKDALQKARDDLERRVEQRTSDLLEANRLLEQTINEQQQTEEALKQSEADLRQLSLRLLHAHEEERKRIGQELHDGLAQNMSAIKFWVEGAAAHIKNQNLKEVTRSLNAIIPLTRGAVEDIRRISRNLRPSTLDDLGILATISWLCDEFEAIYPDIKIEKQINIIEENIPDSLKIIIFRVLQEAMNNITKHSHARHVLLSLKNTEKVIQLTIRDDGIGFDMESASFNKPFLGGIGLASMKERVQYSNGSFSIETKNGAGTTIKAIWE